MGHERGDLDDDWGYSDTIDRTVSEEASIDVQGTVELSELIRDPASMHTICLGTFRKCAAPEDSILTPESLGDGLNDIMDRIRCDPFDHAEIMELWSGSLNFAEFYLLVRELLISMHRAMTVDVDVEDVLVNELNKVNM